MQPGPGMYAAGRKWLQKARIDAAGLQQARIAAARARNVCSWPEMVAAS